VKALGSASHSLLHNLIYKLTLEALYKPFYAALSHSIQQLQFKLKQVEPYVIQIQKQRQK